MAETPGRPPIPTTPRSSARRSASTWRHSRCSSTGGFGRVAANEILHRVVGGFYTKAW